MGEPISPSDPYARSIDARNMAIAQARSASAESSLSIWLAGVENSFSELRAANAQASLRPSEASRSSRDAYMLRRRSLLGVAQSDTVLSPSVLVVRRVETKLDENAWLGGTRIVFESDLKEGIPTGEILCATDKFLLQQVNESDEEKLGPIYTFGAPKVYCGGRVPKIYTYGGMLIDNSIDGSAKSLWMSMYNDYLRGSKCVRSGAVAELYYRDQIRVGYLVHTNLIEDSGVPTQSQFAFGMFVIHEEHVRQHDAGA